MNQENITNAFDRWWIERGGTRYELTTNSRKVLAAVESFTAGYSAGLEKARQDAATPNNN